MFLVFPALIALAAVPPEVLLVRRSMTGIPAPAAETVLRLLTGGLAAAGLGAREVPLSCSGDRTCLAGLARTAHAAAIVGVTVVRSRRGLTVDLEAIDDSERKLAVQTFGVPATGEPFPPDGKEFIDALARAVTTPREEPRVVRLEPEPAAEAKPELTHDNAPARVTAVTTLATGVVAIGLLVAAGVMKASLDAKFQQRPIAQPRNSVQAEVDATNALFSASLGTGLAALALGTTSVIFWVTGPASASASAIDEDD